MLPHARYMMLLEKAFAKYAPAPCHYRVLLHSQRAAVGSARPSAHGR